MITTSQQLTELTTALQRIIAEVVQFSGIEVENLGYYLETDNLTGNDLPQITHRSIRHFENEKGRIFQLSHLRIVNRLVDDGKQKILTFYINHNEQVSISASIQAYNTTVFTYPDQRELFKTQLDVLINNAFEN